MELQDLCIFFVLVHLRGILLTILFVSRELKNSFVIKIQHVIDIIFAFNELISLI
jgi:hypothetical protein